LEFSKSYYRAGNSKPGKAVCTWSENERSRRPQKHVFLTTMVERALIRIRIFGFYNFVATTEYSSIERTIRTSLKVAGSQKVKMPKYSGFLISGSVVCAVLWVRWMRRLAEGMLQLDPEPEYEGMEEEKGGHGLEEGVWGDTLPDDDEDGFAEELLAAREAGDAAAEAATTAVAASAARVATTTETKTAVVTATKRVETTAPRRDTSTGSRGRGRGSVIRGNMVRDGQSGVNGGYGMNNGHRLRGGVAGPPFGGGAGNGSVMYGRGASPPFGGGADTGYVMQGGPHGGSFSDFGGTRVGGPGVGGYGNPHSGGSPYGIDGYQGSYDVRGFSPQSGPQGRGVCFMFQEKGFCSFQNCKFAH
jgi:hypothetical protein